MTLETTTVRVDEVIDRSSLSRFQIVTIALCGIVAILDGFDTQAIAFVAPLIAREWQVDTSSFGPVFGAGLLGLTVGALVFGPVADRLGRKSVIILSTLIFGVFALLTPFSQNISMLLALRFLTGVGLGGAMPNIIALTSEYSPSRRRATLVTLMFCGFPLGAVLGGLISAPLMQAYGWKAVFVLGGVLPLLLLPVLWAWLPESIRFLVNKGGAQAEVGNFVRRIDPKVAISADTRFAVEEQRIQGSPIRQLFAGSRASGTILLWIVFFSNLLIMYFLINWLPAVLQQAGLPIERAIIGTVILNAGGIVGGLLLGSMVDRRGPYGILTLGYALAAAAVATIGLIGALGTPLLMTTIFVAGFFVIGSQFCMNALAANFYPTGVRSTGVGWALGVGRIGSIIGPVLGGILIALAWNTTSIFVAIAVPAVVASVAVFLIGRLGGKRQMLPDTDLVRSH